MEFVSPDPNAQVRAFNVRATFDAFRLVPSAFRRIAERYDLRPDLLRATTMVTVQRWLDALRDIQETVGPAKVRDVGRKVLETGLWPLEDAEATLLSLDAIYHANHRGDVGHYHVQRTSKTVIEVRCETPYPRYFEWGLVEGICLMKANPGVRYAVDFVEGPAAADHTCTLLVERMS